ncbi:MAG: glycerophosphodiester phosphodiesterase [Candidatus Paceibacterota bacterium]
MFNPEQSIEQNELPKLTKEAIRGHRGVGKDQTNADKPEKNAPAENSLAALERAVEFGVGIEFDVWKSEEGELILWHDNPSDLKLKDKDKYENLATLKQVFEMVRENQIEGNKIPLDIELKDLQAAEAVMEMLSGEYNDLLGEQTKIISFNEIVLEAVDKIRKERSVDVATDFLYEHKPEAGKPAPEDPIGIARQIGAKFIIPHYPLLKGDKAKELVDVAAEYGIKVGTWTVDDKQEAQRLIQAGLASVTTNEPESFFEK